MFGMLNSVWGGGRAGMQPNVKAPKAADVQPDLNDSDEEHSSLGEMIPATSTIPSSTTDAAAVESPKQAKRVPKQVEPTRITDPKAKPEQMEQREGAEEAENLEQLREELEEAMIERDAANAEKEELRRQKDQTSRELQRATREKDRLLQQKEKQSRELSNCVQECSELRAILLSAQEERDRATEDLSSSNRERDRIKRELREKQDEIDAVLRQLELTKARAAQRESELEKELEESRSALKSRKECQTCDAKEERLQALQSELQALRQRQGQQNDTYLTRIQQLESEVVHLNLQKLLASAVETDQQVRAEAENLRGELNNANQMRQMAEEAHALHTQELQTQLAEARDVQLGMAERVSELEQELSRLQQLRAAELNGLHEQVMAFARMHSSPEGMLQVQQRLNQREEELARSELLRRAMEHELENQHQQLAEAKSAISDLRSRLSNSQRWQSGAELVFQQLQQRCRELELQLEQSRVVAAGVPVAAVPPASGFAPQPQPTAAVPWLAAAAPKEFYQPAPVAPVAPVSSTPINPHAAPFRSSRVAAQRSQALPIVAPAVAPARSPSLAPAQQPMPVPAPVVMRPPTQEPDVPVQQKSTAQPTTSVAPAQQSGRQFPSSSQLMEHLFTVLSGCMVELQLKDGTRYQGLFYQKKPSELSIKVVQARLCSSAVHRGNAHCKPRTSLRISSCDIVYLAALDVALLPDAEEEPRKALAIE